MKSFLFMSIVFSGFFCLGTSVIHGGLMQRNEGYGLCSYKKETVDFINVNGSASFDEIKVQGKTIVNGSLYADESAMNTLQVNGRAQLKNCSISSEAVINGALLADNTNFGGELSVASQQIKLGGCSVASIRIREVASYTGTQVVELRSGTKVNGSITVESGKGEVWLFSNSQVIGEIIGAQVIEK